MPEWAVSAAPALGPQAPAPRSARPGQTRLPGEIGEGQRGQAGLFGRVSGRRRLPVASAAPIERPMICIG